MSRIPPNLLYLTIYNPTLQPIDPTSEDDEDAEEQAHILFYTSQERAVSRDRMLRQVGLAKALVHFSNMFNNNADTYNNVHSQSKRMIMVSPEPDFWIHAAIEVAKVPRSSPKGKSADKSRHAEKAREKEKATDSGLLFDYQEGSVHDLALRSDIMRGYERFKLTHGSFTSVLSKLGREALSLQLERFFTVWAWSWNLEDAPDFTNHLGIPLHSMFRTLIPVLDNISDKYGKPSLLISPPYVVPSSLYTASSYPESLAQHLLSLAPPPPPISNDDSQDGILKNKNSNDPSASKEPPKTAPQASNSTFLGIPTVNIDMRKWDWPGYLTFGKGSGKRPGLEEVSTPASATEREEKPVPDAPISSVGVTNLDKSALEDAFSDNVPASATNAVSGAELSNNESSNEPPLEADHTESTKSHTPQVRDPADAEANNAYQDTRASQTFAIESPTQPIEKPLPRLSSVNVHLANPGNPLHTIRQKVFYILHETRILALIGFEEDPLTSVPELAQSMFTILEDIDANILEELSKTITPDQLPSAQKILQPTDANIISSGRYTLSSPNFSSSSSYLYDAQQLHTKDPDVLEVFSRGLNPQHWHVARRGIDMDLLDQGSTDQGEVYVQIFRKEASLSDVDNVLAGVARRSGYLNEPV